MIKVLHVITGLNDGGAEGVLTRLCLHSKGASHMVVSLMDGGKYGPILQKAGVRVLCLGMNPGKPSIAKFVRLVRIIRAEKPDIVQTWMYHADLLGGIAARLAGIQRVFWGIRHSTLQRGKSKRSTIFIARLCAILSRWVPEKIICCANKALLVHADIGYVASKLLVVSNGYDLLSFKPDVEAGKKVRDELALGPDEFVIGKVARFDPQKDHDSFLKALKLVASHQVPFRCILIGRDLSHDNATLVATIAELGMQDKILLVGQRKDIPAVMNAIDLHVLSSAYGEAFPNVIAEAMACGTPCVSTDVGDAVEIVGDAGLCCSSRDPKALSDLIVKMAQERQHSPGEWQLRKIECVERIAGQFSMDEMVMAFEGCWVSSMR